MPSWDLFCAVVDNFGDVGVCWRLARQLSSEYGISVRLWVDHLETFAAMCSELVLDQPRQMLDAVEVRHWKSPFVIDEVADVVIEAFGCELPVAYVAAMAKRPVAPVWINLEYLSAESWVDDCHRLASPHPRLPLKKYFFYPGFTERTGGLLRERELLASLNGISQQDQDEFWDRLNVAPRQPQELRLSLFSYRNVALPELLSVWSQQPIPIRLLVSPGPARDQIADWFQSELVDGVTLERESLIVQSIPFLKHTDYDRLLRLCDVNFVRGEDSFVRAQWAQRPFIWQIYPQDDDAHFVKLDAFLARYVHGMPPDPSDAVRKLWSAWNGAIAVGAAWCNFRTYFRSIQEQTEQWSSQLDRMPDLADNLVRFVREK